MLGLEPRDIARRPRLHDLPETHEGPASCGCRAAPTAPDAAPACTSGSATSSSNARSPRCTPPDQTVEQGEARRVICLDHRVGQRHQAARHGERAGSRRRRRPGKQVGRLADRPHDLLRRNSPERQRPCRGPPAIEIHLVGEGSRRAWKHSPFRQLRHCKSAARKPCGAQPRTATEGTDHADRPLRQDRHRHRLDRRHRLRHRPRPWPKPAPTW